MPDVTDNPLPKYVPWAIVGAVVLGGAWVLSDLIIRALESLFTIAQLEIGLKQHAEMIDQMEGKIAESTTYYNELSQMLKQNRTILSPDDLKDFEDELGTLKHAGDELIATRDQEVENH